MAKRPACNTPVGAEIVQKAIRSSRFDCPEEVFSFEWWKDKDCKSYIPLECSICKFKPKAATIDKFMQRSSAACWCNNQAKWCSEEGADRLESLVSSSAFELLPEYSRDWFVSNGCCELKLPIRCKQCLYCPQDCLLRHFKCTQTAACWCNGQADWRGEQGRKRLVGLVLQNGLEPAPQLLSETWWLANVKGKNSKVPFRCSICNEVSDSTSIDNFVRRGDCGCSCTKKSESKVFNYTKSKLPEFVVKNDQSLFSKTSPSGGTLRYDVVVLNKSSEVVFVVEVDGRQHFLDLYWGNRDRDLQKEIDAIAHGIPMLRLYQPDIHTGSFDWRAFLDEKIEAALNGALEIAVHVQPDCPAYTSGVYVELRKKT